MAITIDQFLRDLTERRILSGEEASAVRQELAPTDDRSASAATNRREAKNGSASHTATQTVSVPDSSPLVLCNCLVKERIQDFDNHLIFRAQHLQKDATVSLHILVPRGSMAIDPNPDSVDGASDEKVAQSSASVAILDVGRHGDMMCVCCQPIEAESLLEVVQQYEKLPWELATESLLETVKTLARLQSQGLQLESISPEQLLLDEEGQVHLTGQNLATTLRHATSPMEGSPPPTIPLFESLGALYLFLQTGQSAAPSGKWSEDEAGSKSAALIYQRLTRTNGMACYESWTGLIHDLESLLAGQELLSPALQTVEPTPTPIPEPAGIAAQTAEKLPTDSETSSSRQGLVIGLVLLGGIAVAVAAWLMR